ncbi:uncharacterized protein LOC128959693 [Oppia nitens]|uniref:uncharacterized protein LOC128959693 n=1 Tax=Oppia nitens TaxID=1686743 RepID=UPI0023DB1616|nr:uncharacterized protein LOC128959693 [Oppia nitens]
MDLVPETYQTFNHLPRQFADSTMRTLAAKNRLYNLVIDIGPGDGGITRKLAKLLRHRRFVAIDGDPKMIDYCRRQDSDLLSPPSGVEYVLQDLSLPWNQMSESVGQLAGQADLIFSNFVLHFIPDKHQLLDILSRLLATDGGGSLHANLLIVADLTDRITTAVPLLDGTKHLYLSADKQLSIWRQALEANGLTIDEFRVTDSEWRLTRKEMIAFIPVLIQHYNTMITEPKQFLSLREQLANPVFDAYTNPTGGHNNPDAWTKFLADNTVADVVLHMKILSIIAHK